MTTLSPVIVSLIIGVGALLTLGVAALVWKVFFGAAPAAGLAVDEHLQRAREQIAELKAQLDAKTQEVGTLKREVANERDEKLEQQGKSKQLFAQHTKLESQLDHVMKERDKLQKEVSKHEEAAERYQKQADDRLAKLEAAKISLDQERARVIHEDEEQRRLMEEERDRIWAEHEKSVIATLTELCKQPQFSFTCYSNTNLPEGFDGKLKPDFMIEFLDQYIIFDAKKSKSESLKTYIANTVKETVAKVKKNDKIASMIFLVVPTEAIAELKTHHHQHEGYTLYVVSPEALAPILASLKRITTYEFAEQLDPQQRENIVQFIAELDFHINLRNAADIVLAAQGAEVLEKGKRLDPLLLADVQQKKLPMNAKATIAASELKRLVDSAVQKDEIARLVAPKPAVKKRHLEQVQEVMDGGLFGE